MSITVPDFAPSDGAVLTLWVPTLANPAAPTLAELTGANALMLSCYWQKDQDPAWEADTATEEDNPACLKDTIRRPGRTTWTAEALAYRADPQNPESVANKAYMTLLEDLRGFLVQRHGKYVEDFPKIEAGDVVTVWSALLGKQAFQRQEENGKVTVRQDIFETRRMAKDYLVPAA